MSEIFDIIFSLDFMRRSCCGEWNPYLQWLYSRSQFCIFMAYMIIPLLLFVNRWNMDKHKLDAHEIKHIQRTFAAFILFCGLGHIEGFLFFHYPYYHLFSLWHSVTALVSIYACWVTFKYKLTATIGSSDRDWETKILQCALNHKKE